MPTIIVNCEDLTGRFAELMLNAKGGSEVLVMENDIPVARLVPIGPGQPRILGLGLGEICIAPDFNDPLPDEFWVGDS